MVTLVQQHQESALEENQYQKESDQASRNIVIECDEAEDCCNEIVQSQKNPTAVIPRTSSLASSSTQCSEIENNDEEEETDTDEGDWVPDLPVPAVLQHHQQVTTADGNLVLPNADTSNFGDVRVKNSSNVHLGNKTFYKGPVTIKQFVYTNSVPVQESEFVTTDANNASKCDTSDSTNASGVTPNFSQKDWWNFTWNDRDTIIDFDETENTQPRYKKCLTKVLNWLWSWRCVAFTCMIALILVIVVTIACVYFTHDTTIPPQAIIPQIPDSGLNGSIVKNVRFIERSEWGAQPPAAPLTKMKLPVPYVIISHTATELCVKQSECTFHVRFAQTFHIESRKWSDIAYNFLVGGDGYAYVGRSWDYVGAHSFGLNNVSIGISFIGTFNSVIPNPSQLYAAQQLIKVGVEAGKIAPNYKLLGHRQISQTLSPGDALYKVIQTWPHWSSSP